MGRPKRYTNPARVHLVLPDDLKKKASKHAFNLGMTGGLTELVSRLLVAELSNKQIAAAYGRKLETAAR